MMNFNVQHFRIWTTSVINICIRSYCLGSELYIATALETQQQATKMLKTNCTHKFCPRWSVSHSSLAIFRSHVNIYSLYRRIFYVCVSGLYSLNRALIISRFCSILWIVILAGLKKIVSYIIPRTLLIEVPLYNRLIKMLICQFSFLECSTDFKDVPQVSNRSYYSIYNQRLCTIITLKRHRIICHSQAIIVACSCLELQKHKTSTRKKVTAKRVNAIVAVLCNQVAWIAWSIEDLYIHILTGTWQQAGSHDFDSNHLANRSRYVPLTASVEWQPLWNIFS